jgi:hypothetical protein
MDAAFSLEMDLLFLGIDRFGCFIHGGLLQYPNLA